MGSKKPTYEELESRLTDAEAVITTLRRGEVDAIIGERDVALLRAKEAEQALQQSQAELDIRNQIANIFLTVPDDEMYGEVLQVILKAMRSRYGIFGYIDELGDLVIPSMTRDIWQKCEVRDKTIVYPPENWGGIWGRALKEKKTLYTNRDLHVPEGHIPIVRVIVVPILYHQELIGLLEVANKETDYDEKDKSCLETIANYIAPILNARLERDKQEKERRRAEEALRQSEHDLNRAQAVAQTGSWRLDVRHNQLLWSDETHRIFGIPKGTPMTYETFLSSVHLEDREYVDQKWTAALRGEPYDIEHRIIVGDEVKWIRERAELEFDSRGLLKGGFGTAQDITERKQAEERIREQAQILEQVHDVVICTDLEGYILSWNIGAERVYGYSAEEVLGKHISSMYKDEQSKNPFYQQVIKPLLEKGSHDVEVEVPTKTGEERFVHLSFSGIRDSSGNVAMICGYGIDITERKKLEQLKDEFIGLVSHELGSPLTVITGCLNTVLDQATNLSEQEASHLLRNAAKEADALTHLLGNLLELARVQAERLFLHVEPVETDIVARNVIEKMTEQYPTYELLLDFPEELPPVDADPLRVERILYNLLDNACKYSPKGSKVRVFAKPDKDSVIIGISDQGVGIATSDREKIFQAFERIDSSVSGRGKGTGIGLLVCQRLVEAHGGRIWVKSASGKGSTFFFNLPCKRKG